MGADRNAAASIEGFQLALYIRLRIDRICIAVTSGDHILHSSSIISNHKGRGCCIPGTVLLLHIHIADHIDVLYQCAIGVISHNRAVIGSDICRVSKILGRCKVHTDAGTNIRIAILDNTSAIIPSADTSKIIMRCQVRIIDNSKVLNRAIVRVSCSAYNAQRESSLQVIFHDNILHGAIIIRDKCTSVTVTGCQLHLPVQVKIGNLRAIPQCSDQRSIHPCLRNRMSLGINLSIEIRYHRTSSGCLKIFYDHEFTIGEHGKLRQIRIIGNTVSRLLCGKMQLGQKDFLSIEFYPECDIVAAVSIQFFLMMPDFRFGIKGIGLIIQHLIGRICTINAFCLIPADRITSRIIIDVFFQVTAWVIDCRTDICIEFSVRICLKDLTGFYHLLIVFPDFQLCILLVSISKIHCVFVVCNPHIGSTGRSLEFKAHIDLVIDIYDLIIAVIESDISLFRRLTSGLHIIMPRCYRYLLT